MAHAARPPSDCETGFDSPVPAGVTGGMLRCRVRAGDDCITYLEAGAGPDLVLVHGLSGSSRWWGKNVPALAAHFRVRVVDLIGFGGSRGGRSFVLSEAAGVLDRWMNRLRIARAHVVGHSMGGFIAAELAATFPQRVDRLVLVAAAALPMNRTWLRHAVGLAHSLRYMSLGFLPVLAMDAARAGPVTILSAAHQLLTADIRAQLARVRAPALVVWGSRDTVVPPEVGRELAQSLPDARLLVFEGAGHNPMWDRAGEFNRAVTEFLLRPEPRLTPGADPVAKARTAGGAPVA